MSAGAAKGERRGGRKKGSANKATKDVIERLAALNCDPVEGMAKLAMGEAPCLCCVKGMVTAPQYYKLIRKAMPAPPDGETQADQADSKLTCPNCGGSCLEPVDAALSGNMFKELAQYVAPKRKAIEHSGGETPIEIATKIMFKGRAKKD